MTQKKVYDVNVRTERLAEDTHSSLLGPFESYEEKGAMLIQFTLSGPPQARVGPIYNDKHGSFLRSSAEH